MNKKEIKNKNYEYIFKPMKIKDYEISALIEFKRYKMISDLADDLKKYLEDNKYFINYNDCFGLILEFIFGNNNNNVFERLDPIFPINGKIFKGLKEAFIFILNKNIKKKYDIDYDNLLNNFKFGERCDQCIIKISEFRNSYFYLKNKNNFLIEIKNNIFNMDESDNNIMVININYIGETIVSGDLDILNMSFKIYKFLYSKLLNQNKIYCYENKKDFNEEEFKKLLVCLLLRYETIKASNEQLACNPEFYYEMKKKLNYDFELFGSALNTQYHQFCSLFYDLEKYFLSRGSFFDIECLKGKYVANPPFVNEVIEKMALKMIDSLDKNNNKEALSYFITIPGWESNEEYGEYTGFEIMKKSKYMSYFKEIPKEEARFFNYYKNQVVYPCKIFFLILENKKSEEEYNLKDDINKLIKDYFYKPNGKENSYIPEEDIFKKRKDGKTLKLLKLKGGYIEKRRIDEMKFEMKDYDLIEDIENKRIKKLDSLELKIEECFDGTLKKNKIKEDLIFVKDGYDYETKEAKQFYKKWSVYRYLIQMFPTGTKFYRKNIENKIKEKEKDKKDKKIVIYQHIQNYTFYAFKSIFKNINKIDKLCLIDLTKNSEKTNKWIIDRLYLYYDEIMKHFILKNNFVATECKVLYRGNSSILNQKKNIINFINNSVMKVKKSEYDFVIMTGSLSYYDMSSISYFYEQLNVFNFFIQLLLLMNYQKEEGSFIMFFYTCDTKPFEQILTFLNNYYEELCLEKIYESPERATNLSYVFGRGFKGINNIELNKLYKIYDKIINVYGDDIGDNLNIFDVKKRKKYNIYKPIQRKEHNNFISSLFKIDTSKSFRKKLKDYNKKVFKDLIKRMKKYRPLKKKCSLYNQINYDL